MACSGWGSKALASQETKPPAEPKKRVWKDVWTPGQTQYEEVWAAGCKAFSEGLEMHEGPYELGPEPEYNAWADGWEHAHQGYKAGVRR